MYLHTSCYFAHCCNAGRSVRLGGEMASAIRGGHELLTVAAARVQAFNVVQGRLRGHLCDSRILHCLVEVVREKVILEYGDNICTENLINKIINRARLIF